DRALNALRTAARASVSPEEAARLLARIGDATGIAWVHQRIREIEPADPWERTALADLRGDLLDVQAAIAQSVLAGGAADADAALDAFRARHADRIAQIRELQREIGAPASVSALAVVLRRLRPLA